MQIFIMLVAVLFLGSASGFFHGQATRLVSRRQMADVEITFPNNKKVKAAAGSPLKDAAKKAGFSPNYGCEEGEIEVNDQFGDLIHVI